MNVAVFEGLLKRAIGLDAASIGQSAILRAVRARMAALECADAEAYADMLTTARDELQALIESVVVPETWFFRDREAFTLLAAFARERCARSDRPLRVLSAPCATGEEPYSVIMALLDAGLPANRLEIDAIDISERALARARAAEYGRNSFRGGDLLFRDRYFEPRGASWRLNDTVRGLARVRHANLLDPAFAADRPPCDVVFCRNLLIYFDRATQDQAVAVLARLLLPDGLLFVGPSETALLVDHGFEPVRAPLAFALTPPSRAATPVVTAPSPARAAIVRRPGPGRPAKPPRSPEWPKVQPTPSRTDPLAEIARLADAGHLAEAARQCEQYLRADGGSAQAWYLLAVVRDATGRHREAAGLYRKALYLNPEHHEALVHLAYLLRAEGDTTGADVLLGRLRRRPNSANTASSS